MRCLLTREKQLRQVVLCYLVVGIASESCAVVIWYKNHRENGCRVQVVVEGP